MGAVRVALRQGAVFRGRFRRGDVPLPAADARLSGSRPEFLRAEHDARSRWTASGVGLGQRFSWRTWLEWLSVFAAPIEFVARRATSANAGAAVEQAARQACRVAKCSAG